VQSNVARTATARREPLSRERIAQAALNFIDRHGLDELSTRRLGKALGVEGMALYKHFPSRDALLDAVAELLLCELTVPPAGLGWAERVKVFARSYRAIARVHPRAYRLLATRRLTSEGALGVLNALFAALLEEGFTASESVLLFRIIGNYCNGMALDELAILESASTGPRTLAKPLAEVDQFFHPAHFDTHFETGLELLLEGFARRRRGPERREKEKKR
jgi:AcrR family transcriptional regulator